MRIAIVYPPFREGERWPLLSQNRIFSFTNSERIKIYPYVLASAATLLKHEGNDVLYLDGINERLSWDEFAKTLVEFEPQICVFETKTPIIRRHWEFIDRLKSIVHPSTLLGAGSPPYTVLIG